MGGAVGGEDQTSATDPGAVAADERAAVRRNPWNGVLVGLCLVALVAAGVIGLWSRAAFSDAATARHQAAAADAERVDLVQRAADDGQRRRDLNLAAADVSTALQTYADAVYAVSTDENDLVDIENRAVDLRDQGRGASATGVLQSEGDAKFADITQKVAGIHQDLADVQAKIQALEAKLDG